MAREIPVSLLTEFRLRPCSTSASARLRVLTSYMRAACEIGRSDTQQKADVHENVSIRLGSRAFESKEKCSGGT